MRLPRTVRHVRSLPTVSRASTSVSGGALGDFVSSDEGWMENEMEVVAGAAEKDVGLARFDYQHVSRTELHRLTTTTETLQL
jgi:hypothetical protein